LINGSLRGTKAASHRLLDRLNRLLDPSFFDVTRVSVRAHLGQSYPEADLEALNEADAVVFAFPLYVYCLSSAAVRLLEEWARYACSRPAGEPTRLYAIVNSGSAMPEINAEAVRVVRNFCARLGLTWRFAIEIGCGPAVLMLAPIDLKLRRALRRMAADIGAGSHEEPMGNELIRPMLPKPLMDGVRNYLDRKALKDITKTAVDRTAGPRA